MMDTVQYAGFWRRSVALMIDGMIISTFIQPLYMRLPILLGMQSDTFQQHTNMMLMQTGLMLIVAVCYAGFFNASSWQATPGKRLLNSYIADATTHQRISILRSFGRYIVLNSSVLLVMVLMLVTMPPAAPQVGVAVDTDQIKINRLVEKQAMWTRLSKEEQQRIGQASPELRMTEEEERLVEQAYPASVRFFGVCVVVLALGLIIPLTAAFTREKKGVHDMVCNTRVLRGRPQSQIANA